MNEMIEMVAKAISGRTFRRDIFTHEPGNLACPCSTCVAYAAIKAISEPSEAMKQAAAEALMPYTDHPLKLAVICLRAAFDAALKDVASKP